MPVLKFVSGMIFAALCLVCYTIGVGRGVQREREIETTKRVMEYTRPVLPVAPRDPPGWAESEAAIDAYLAEEPEIEIRPVENVQPAAVEWRSLVNDRRFQEAQEDPDESNFDEIEELRRDREVREIRDKMERIERRERFRR